MYRATNPPGPKRPCATNPWGPRCPGATNPWEESCSEATNLWGLRHGSDPMGTLLCAHRGRCGPGDASAPQQVVALGGWCPPVPAHRP